MKKEIEPEKLIRDSELVNRLSEALGEKGKKLAKEFLELNELQQTFAILDLGIYALTGEHIDLIETARSVTFLSASLDELEKRLLINALNSVIKAIYTHLENTKKEN